MANLFYKAVVLGHYSYRKSSIKPPGGFFDLDLPEGFISEGSLLTKASDKDICDSFSVLYPMFCGINIQFSDSNT